MIRTILVIRKMMFIIRTSFPNIIFLPIIFLPTFRAGLCSSCSVGSCSASTWQLIAGSWQLIHDDSEAENEDDDENDNGNDSNGHWPFGATADRDNDNDNEYDNEITIPQESSINTTDNNVFSQMLCQPFGMYHLLAAYRPQPLLLLHLVSTQRVPPRSSQQYPRNMIDYHKTRTYETSATPSTFGGSACAITTTITIVITTTRHP